jgi:competence protein ComEA
VPLAAEGRAVSWRVIVRLLLVVALGVTVFAAAVLARGQAPPRPSVLVAARAGWSAPAPTSAGGGSAPASTVPFGSVSGSGSASTSAGSGGAASALPSATAGPSVSATPAQLVVDVSGRVRRPGLVRVPAGSRVWDAVVAAGGPAAGASLARLNLARPLADGEQVLVLAAAESAPEPIGPQAEGPPAESGSGGRAGAAAAGATPTAPGQGARVDLNTATVAQLDALPGIGPVLAARIASWRTAHGRFTRAEELGEVAGIGEKLLAQLRPLVSV